MLATLTIAKTISQQIGANTMMCIGAHKLQAVNSTIETDPESGHLGGLTFKINPNPKMKVRGRVTVTLAGNDTYNVKIETCRGKVLLDRKDIYNSDLGGPSGVIEGVTG